MDVHTIWLTAASAIELTPEGDERLTAAGVSLYDGYALRSVMPDAVTLRYDLPLTEVPMLREFGSLHIA